MSPSKDLIERIRQIVTEVAERPIDTFTPDASIESLGIDSIALTEVVVLIEERLGVDVPSSSWLSVRTIGDFVALVANAPRVGANE